MTNVMVNYRIIEKKIFNSHKNLNTVEPIDFTERNCCELRSIPAIITKVPADNGDDCKRTRLESSQCSAINWNNTTCELFSKVEEIWSLKESCKSEFLHILYGLEKVLSSV